MNESIGMINTIIANRMIWVTFEKEGIHCYPQAATDPALADVAFLAHPHRHLFKFKVWIQVQHADRDLEFFQFKRWLQSLLDSRTINLDNQSCEMMADSLHGVIQQRYPHREIWIEVSEDGENGTFVRYAEVK